MPLCPRSAILPGRWSQTLYGCPLYGLYMTTVCSEALGSTGTLEVWSGKTEHLPDLVWLGRAWVVWRGGTHSLALEG